jgi:hypothetical protein
MSTRKRKKAIVIIHDKLSGEFSIALMHPGQINAKSWKTWSSNNLAGIVAKASKMSISDSMAERVKRRAKAKAMNGDGNIMDINSPRISQKITFFFIFLLLNLFLSLFVLIVLSKCKTSY